MQYWHAVAKELPQSQTQLCKCSVGNALTDLHVLLKLVTPLQVVHIPLDGHVVQAEQVVEHNAKGIFELLLICSLQHDTPSSVADPEMQAV